MEQQKPETEGRLDKGRHEQVSDAVGDSEWWRDRELEDEPVKEEAEEELTRNLPPETPDNYRETP